jgi:hypothetical protein
VIIPNLSKSTKDEGEKNAYLFITKHENNDGFEYYSVESNIPISSFYGKTYDGYTMSLDLDFYKNQIPSSWTSIMSILVNNDIVLYRGIAYPSKSAPLIRTKTGIGPDSRMNEILLDKSSLVEIKNKLKEAVEEVLKNYKTDNQRQTDSTIFLEKDMNISLSAYSYLGSQFEDAKKYFDVAEGIIVDVPDDLMGSNYKELKRIMDYLINTIGE